MSEIKVHKDFGADHAVLSVAVSENDEVIAKFKKLDDADTFAVAKRREIAAQKDNAIKREIESLRAQADKLEKETAEYKGRDSDCG